MKKIPVTISKSPDGSFWCHTEIDVYDSSLNSCGRSVKEAKDDLFVCLDESRKDVIENGNSAEDVEFVYKYDLQSFFNYFSFLNISEIAKRAKINPSLMRQYARGIKHAGEKTYSRLETCLSDITKELQAASFRE